MHASGRGAGGAARLRWFIAAVCACSCATAAIVSGLAGSAAAQDASVAPTSRAGPVISGVTAFDVTQTTARITWGLDRPATGQVEYGVTSAYGSRSEPELSFRYLIHIQPLGDLLSGTEYHYRVRSTDEAGRESVSADHTFVTLPPGGPVATGSPGPISATGVYGSGIATDGLGNTQVGGDSSGSANLRSSYRFRATASAALDSIRIYVLAPEHPGYAAGSGGTISISVQSDDGTGAPDGVPMASTVLTPTTSAGVLVEFPEPAVLEQGRLYHIVFVNTDLSPTENFSSINDLFLQYSSVSDPQPGIGNGDWAHLIDRGDGWIVRPGYTPIMQLDYSNGQEAGMGYTEIWGHGNPAFNEISGRARVRETFTVSGTDRVVRSVSVRLAREYGDGALTVRLGTGDGAVIRKGTIPASDVAMRPRSHDSSGGDWVTLEFASPRTLRVGQTYRLVLSAPGDTLYWLYVIRKGSHYGYSDVTYFADGHAQIDDGSGWIAPIQDGSGPLDEADLQFYFR